MKRLYHKYRIRMMNIIKIDLVATIADFKRFFVSSNWPHQDLVTKMSDNFRTNWYALQKFVCVIDLPCKAIEIIIDIGMEWNKVSWIKNLPKLRFRTSRSIRELHVTRTQIFNAFWINEFVKKNHVRGAVKHEKRKKEEMIRAEKNRVLVAWPTAIQNWSPRCRIT